MIGRHFQIEELRDILGASEDEQDDEQVLPSAVPAQHSSTTAALFGYRAIAHSLLPYHPPLQQAVHLFAAFSENVIPILRIFHFPSLSTMYWEAVASPASLDKNIEALIFAIYYSATVSLPPDQCLSLMGLPREAAIERYRFAAEQAIARAELLTTQSVVLLQATTLFINALRAHDGSRISWSLTTLVFSLAQTMGLHRDGTAFGLKPFETEMRRRLWWHICILDSRSSDHHGFGPMLYQSQYDTRMPLNINDEDISPDMAETPPERDEATDMCFCLVRCESMVAATKTRLMSPDVPLSVNRHLGPSSVSLSERINMIKELEARLQDRYIRHCTPSSPIQRMTILLSRLIIVHFWLMTCYPLMRQDDTRDRLTSETSQQHLLDTTSNSRTAHSEPLPNTISSDIPSIMSRDQLFSSSIEILQLSSQILDVDAAHRWSWYSKIHVQWHVVAFVLSEICRRHPSAQCDQAWTAVSAMYAVWNVQSGSTPGLMWKSVRRLMARTRYVREMQARRNTDSAVGRAETGANTTTIHALESSPDFQNIRPKPASTSTCSPPGWDAFFTAQPTESVNSAAQLDFHQGVFGMADDPFMNMLDLPTDLPMGDILGSLDSDLDGILGGLDNANTRPDQGVWASW